MCQPGVSLYLCCYNCPLSGFWPFHSVCLLVLISSLSLFLPMSSRQLSMPLCVNSKVVCPTPSFYSFCLRSHHRQRLLYLVFLLSHALDSLLPTTYPTFFFPRFRSVILLMTSSKAACQFLALTIYSQSCCHRLQGRVTAPPCSALPYDPPVLLPS